MEPFPIEKSEFYRVYLLEREEIERFRQIESEKAGQEMTWDHAIWLWTINGNRSRWMATIRGRINPS